MGANSSKQISDGQGQYEYDQILIPFDKNYKWFVIIRDAWGMFIDPSEMREPDYEHVFKVSPHNLTLVATSYGKLYAATNNSIVRPFSVSMGANTLRGIYTFRENVLFHYADSIMTNWNIIRFKCDIIHMSPEFGDIVYCLKSTIYWGRTMDDIASARFEKNIYGDLYILKTNGGIIVYVYKQTKNFIHVYDRADKTTKTIYTLEEVKQLHMVHDVIVLLTGKNKLVIHRSDECTILGEYKTPPVITTVRGGFYVYYRRVLKYYDMSKF